MEVVDKLKTNKYGLTVTNNIDLIYYTCFFFGVWLFFFLLYFAIKWFHDTCAFSWYASKDQHIKNRWNGAVIANVHHLSIFIYVFYIFTHSVCDNAYPFIWFYDDVCFLTMDKKFVYVSLFSAGFLCNDFWVQKYIVAA